MGAQDLLAEPVRAGFSIEAADDVLTIRPASKLTDDLRAAVRRAKPELLRLLSSPPRRYRLTKTEGGAAHAEPWDDAACARFVARVALFPRRRVDATNADDLAERLHLRDLQGDDRRLCLECSHLAQHAVSGWRCGNAPAAHVERDLPAEMVAQLQRCPAFRE